MMRQESLFNLDEEFKPLHLLLIPHHQFYLYAVSRVITDGPPKCSCGDL